MAKLSPEDKEFVINLLVDSELQDELMNNPGDPRIWALDYVYDSRLQESLWEEEVDSSDDWPQNGF